MTEENQEQPRQIVVVNFKEQVEMLIDAGKLAAKTNRYDRRKSDTLIYFNEGNEQGTNPTLSEYLKRAESKIISEMMPQIIKEAESMINEELNSIRECLK